MHHQQSRVRSTAGSKLRSIQAAECTSTRVLRCAALLRSCCRRLANISTGAVRSSIPFLPSSPHLANHAPPPLSYPVHHTLLTTLPHPSRAYPPTDQWGQKAIRRKTTGTGRMRYMKDLPRRFKNGFREGACSAPVVGGSCSGVAVGFEQEVGGGGGASEAASNGDSMDAGQRFWRQRLQIARCRRDGLEQYWSPAASPQQHQLSR